MIRRQTKRAGFTLVEMLVATALTLFIMAIISTAFRAGLDTFSKLRTAGELQSKLRNTTKIISRDLAWEHFEPNAEPGGSYPDLYGPKISDQRLDILGWRPSTAGYFMLYQPDLSVLESLSTSEGLGSTRNSVALSSPVMSFTMKAEGKNNKEDPTYAQQFSTNFGLYSLANAHEFVMNNNGSGSVYSRWAQVHYSLVPTGESTEPGPEATDSPLPLFSLRRQVWLLSPKNFGDVPPIIGVSDGDYNLLQTTTQTGVGKVRLIETTTPPPAAGTHNLNFLSIQEVTNPAMRYSVASVSSAATLSPFYTPAVPSGQPYPFSQPTLINAPVPDPNGDDILLNNVICFEIKALWTVGDPGQMGLKQQSSPRPLTMDVTTSNHDWPFDDLPRDSNTVTNQRWFDTWYDDPANPAPPGYWETVPTLSGGTLEQAFRQPPLRIRIKALQIKLRIWDEKAKQTRQVTFIQEV